MLKCPNCGVYLRKVMIDPVVYHCDWCDTNYGEKDFGPNPWVDVIVLAVICLIVLGIGVPAIYSLFR